jgi:hypothetical protein
LPSYWGRAGGSTITNASVLCVDATVPSCARSTVHVAPVCVTRMISRSTRIRNGWLIVPSSGFRFGMSVDVYQGTAVVWVAVIDAPSVIVGTSTIATTAASVVPATAVDCWIERNAAS